MTDDILKAIIRVVFRPETNTERIAHEVLEFVVYGNIYKYLAEQIEDE